MKKCIFIVAMICLIWECSVPPGLVESEIIQEETELLSRAWVNPPYGGTFLDSFKQAFEGIKAVYEFSCGNVEYYEYVDPTIDVPVTMSFSTESLMITFLIRKNVIREYAWNGYLLIALIIQHRI